MSKYCRFPGMTLSLVLILGGCAHYSALPLAQDPAFEKTPETLTGDYSASLPPFLSVKHYNPQDGLDLTEISILAAINNPDLKALRKSADVAQAQAIAAGLLPNPQLDLALDHPTQPTIGLVNGYLAGIAQNITSLFTVPQAEEAAQQTAKKIRLNILWQEWQTIQKARELAVNIVTGEAKLNILEETRQRFTARYTNSLAAYEARDLPFTSMGLNLSAMLDLNAQTAVAGRELQRQRLELNALLGLAPDTKLDIRLPDLPAVIAEDSLTESRKTVALRRPDLLALKAGYQSQDATLRKAVRAQFPSIVLGVNRARDTNPFYTDGLRMAIELPLFDTKATQVHIEEATREQLAEEYQARLNQTASDILIAAANVESLRAQFDELQKHLPSLQEMTANARKAYDNKDIDALTYLNLETADTARQVELVELKKDIWIGTIAEQTALFLPESNGDGKP